MTEKNPRTFQKISKMVNLRQNKAQNPIKFLIITLFLTSSLQTKANILDLEDFGQKLFLKLSTSQAKENQLISAQPVASLLIILRQGAKATAAYEIGEVLGLISQPSHIITVDFLQILEKFKSNPYMQLTNSVSIQANNSEIEKFDLDPTGIIKNRFDVNICHKSESYATQYKDVKLLLSIEFQFKGIFRDQSLSSVKKPFHFDESTTIEKEMLTLSANIRFAEIDELKAKVFEIPYSNVKDTLVILLPNSQQGLEDLELILETFPLKNIESYLQPRGINLQFPKGEVIVERSLKNSLEHLGMTEIFKNLCDISSEMAVSDILFNGSFSIEENNAGVNAPENMDSPDSQAKEEFVIDHPFIFMVKASANETYLIGKFSK